MLRYKFIKMPVGRDEFIVENRCLNIGEVIETSINFDDSAYFERLPMAVPRPPLNNLKSRKNLIGCEIGVYKADHAITILEHLNMKLLYLIDPYPNPETTDYNWFSGRNAEALAAKEYATEVLLPYTNKGAARWIYKRSDEAHKEIPDNSLDFVYIDGDHRTEYCLSDINLYLPKLKNGGLMSGHDYNTLPVKEALRIFLEEHPEYEVLGGEDWWFTK